MKKVLFFLLFPLCLYSQVGINTVDPQAMLDVEGDLRIGLLENGSEFSARDSVLVVDGNRVVKQISAQNIVRAAPKTLIKGHIVGSPSLSNDIIPFNAVDFDLQGEFNTSTHEFVATHPGIYRVNAQFKFEAVISANLDLGLQIYKVDTHNNETLIAQSRYLNLYIDIVLLKLAVSPPIRQVGTLVQLQAGEKIIFKTVGVLNINALVRNSQDTQFTIEQVY